MKNWVQDPLSEEYAGLGIEPGSGPAVYTIRDASLVIGNPATGLLFYKPKKMFLKMSETLFPCMIFCSS